MIECFIALGFIVFGFAGGYIAGQHDKSYSHEQRANKGYIYCKIAGEGDNAIYGWLTPDEYLRIVMTDHGEE